MFVLVVIISYYLDNMRKKVALALSCGGARGLAHIGVIKALEEDGYEISSIAGSSMGAVIGGFYAAGKLDLYIKWVSSLQRLDIFKLMDFTFSQQGFIKGEKVFKEMKTLIEDISIEDLPIPYVAVASDLANQQEVAFREGSLYHAMRASAAIPSIVQPVFYKDQYLVDGGVLNPVPVSQLKRNDDELLVVVNVNAPIPCQPGTDQLPAASALGRFEILLNKWGLSKKEQKHPVMKKLGFFETLSRSVDVMQDKMIDLTIKYYQPDVYVEVSRGACSTFEFEKANELIDLGKEAWKNATHSVATAPIEVNE